MNMDQGRGIRITLREGKTETPSMDENTTATAAKITLRWELQFTDRGSVG